MIDVKKLITGFLILATLAVCSGLALSFIPHPLDTTGGNSSGITINGDGGASSGSAFVNDGSLKGNAAEILSLTDNSAIDAQANDPNNVTNVFANTLYNSFEAANPNGLATDASGTPLVQAPNSYAVADIINKNTAIKNVTIPNWDVEAESQLIKTTTSSNPVDIANYGTALSTVLEKYFVSNGLEGSVESQGVSAPDPSYASGQIQGALGETASLKTPSKLLPFQQSLIRVMVYEKNLAQLATNANADPAKAVLIYQGEQAKYDAALLSLQQQMNNASAMGLSLGDPQKASVPLIAQLFGVKPAKAFWLTFDAIHFGQMIKEWIQNFLLQILKNTLIAAVQRKVLTAIQGSNGLPKFVQDFGAQLVNSYQAATLATLNTELSKVPQYQLGALQSLLKTQYTSPTAIARDASDFISSDKTIQNISSTNFSNFKDYLALFGKGGNAWVNAMTIHDDAMRSGGASQQANQTQNVAQQGWDSLSKTCSPKQGGNPNGYHQACPAGTSMSASGACVDSDGNVYIAENVPNGGKCDDGTDPTLGSPGQLTGQSMMSALQSGTQLITSANDITGIVASIAESLITQFMTQAINSAINAIPNPGVGGVPPSSVTASGGGSSSSTQNPVQCLPSDQPITISTSTGMAQAYVSAVYGAIDSTCVNTGNCPAGANTDGTPTYNWTAPGSQQAGGGITGDNPTLTYTTPGTYTATVTASTDGTTASCQIDVSY